jgi:rRNA maturation endonuclease Nob1
MNTDKSKLEAHQEQLDIPVVMRSALVTPENYFGMEEWYMPVVECPKCKHKVPARNSNYCSGCGIKLKLSTTVQKYADNAW